MNKKLLRILFNSLDKFWLLSFIILKVHSEPLTLCGEQSISGILCYRIFASSTYNPQDIELSTVIPNTTCSFQHYYDQLTITGASLNMNAPLNNSCDFIPSNTTEYNFGPKTFQITNMVVQNTNISTLVKGVFSTWDNVRILSINMNYKLKRIEPGAFDDLFYVWNLTISDNPFLKNLEEETFRGMINLQELRYLRNNLKKISDLSIALKPSILPNVTLLFLSGNCIYRIDDHDFLPMNTSKLNTLVIGLAKTEWIHEKAFDPLSSLVELVLSRNNLDSKVLTPLVNHMINKDPSLRNLQIDQNILGKGIFQLLQTIAQNNSVISYLNLKNNHFGKMQPGFFPKMEKLNQLDLTNVMIDDLPEGVISKESLPNLKRLYLGGNLFTGLEPYMVPETLTRLDLSNNENDLPWNFFFRLNPEAFIKMPHLELLNLSGNKVFIIRKKTFKNARNLKVLFLKNAFLNQIDEGAFLHNSKLFYLDLSYNSFPVINPFTKGIFKGLDNLIALDLSNCGLSYIKYDVFFHLKKLQYLSLKFNAIYEFSPNAFQYMPNLYTIDLRYNILVAWNHRLFEYNKWLNNTLLDFNHIQTITDEMMDDFMMSKVVTLYSNTILCDCKLMNAVAKKMKSLGITDVKKLSFSDKMNTCFYKTESLADFLSLFNSAQCINKEWLVILSATLFTGLFTSLVAYIIYYYYKYDIHFWFLKTKRRLGLLHYIGAKQKGKPNGLKYDAFVSYCKEDEKFVEKMVYILEKEDSRFNLCVYERDFQVGDVLTDRIVNCMDNSRRTILVLTEAFAKSQWCCWEMYIAQSRSISLRTTDQNDPLILIKKSEIPDSLMTPTLKYLMQTRVYLQWHDSPIRQKIFWEQLKDALKLN